MVPPKRLYPSIKPHDVVNTITRKYYNQPYIIHILRGKIRISYSDIWFLGVPANTQQVTNTSAQIFPNLLTPSRLFPYLQF